MALLKKPILSNGKNVVQGEVLDDTGNIVDIPQKQTVTYTAIRCEVMGWFNVKEQADEIDDMVNGGFSEFITVTYCGDGTERRIMKNRLIQWYPVEIEE